MIEPEESYPGPGYDEYEVSLQPVADFKAALARQAAEHPEFIMKDVLKVPVAKWAAHVANADRLRIDNAIRSGLIAGLDSMAIARKVVGSQDLRGVDGVTEITRKQIAALAKAALK